MSNLRIEETPAKHPVPNEHGDAALFEVIAEDEIPVDCSLVLETCDAPAVVRVTSSSGYAPTALRRARARGFRRMDGGDMSVRVFEVAEDEWIAAESAESAAEFYRELVGAETYTEVTEEFGAPLELTQALLNKMRFTDDETTPPRTITFAERLAELSASAQSYPCFFATGNL